MADFPAVLPPVEVPGQIVRLLSRVGGLIGTTTAEKDGLQAKGYNALSFNQWSIYRGKIVKITFTGTILVNHQHPNHRLAAMCIINNGIYSNNLFKVGSQSELLFGKKDNAFYMQIIGGSTILTISPLYIETPITLEDVTGQISSTDIEWL